MISSQVVFLLFAVVVVAMVVFVMNNKKKQQQSISRALSASKTARQQQQQQKKIDQINKQLLEEQKRRQEQLAEFEINIRLIVLKTLLIIVLMSLIVTAVWGTDQDTLIKLGGALSAVVLLRVREVREKRKEQIETIEEKLPEAMEIVSRCMNAGQTLTEALSYCAKYSHPVIARELMAVTRLVNLGVTLNEAALQSAKRLSIDAFGAFMVVLMIHERTGGNLVNILSNMADLFRQQRFLRMRIAELTSEGRMNAYVMVLTPMLLLGILYYLQRDFVAPLFNTTVGQYIFYGSLAFECMAVFIIYRILNFSKL